MTYGGFQRFDECQAYYKMRREQKEDDASQAEFDREVERQNELEIERQREEDVHDLENHDIENLVNEESKEEE